MNILLFFTLSIFATVNPNWDAFLESPLEINSYHTFAIDGNGGKTEIGKDEYKNDLRTEYLPPSFGGSGENFDWTLAKSAKKSRENYSCRRFESGQYSGSYKGGPTLCRGCFQRFGKGTG